MMGIPIGLLTVLVGSLSQQPIIPTCTVEPGRQAERITGTVKQREDFNHTTPSGWILRLAPVDHGWLLQLAMKGRESEDLSRLTPPWHFVPNPRQLEGWHFRNADNTGPNDGSVNAPGALRDFIFSPSVGRGIEYNGSATTADVSRRYGPSDAGGSTSSRTD